MLPQPTPQAQTPTTQPDERPDETSGLNGQLSGARPVKPMDCDPWAFCGRVSLSAQASMVACPKPITTRTPVRLSSGRMLGEGPYRTPTGAVVPRDGRPPSLSKPPSESEIPLPPFLAVWGRLVRPFAVDYWVTDMISRSLVSLPRLGLFDCRTGRCRRQEPGSLGSDSRLSLHSVNGLLMMQRARNAEVPATGEQHPPRSTNAVRTNKRRS